MKRARTLAILAATALLLTGCGQSEEPGEPESPPAEETTPAEEETTPPETTPPEDIEPPPEEETTPPEDGEPPAEEETTPPETTPPEDGEPPAEEHDDERVGAAVADLVERTGDDSDQVQVVQFQGVTWRDGSIGCPQEGMNYTQALVDGHLLVLESGGEQYRYHASGEDDFFLCEDPQEPMNGDTM